MASFHFNNIRIAGIAGAVPKKIVKSEEYVDVFGESTVQKFVEMTGVRERRVTFEHQTASDLGYAAAEKLLQEKQIDRDTIGVLIFGSHCPDYRKPATAAVLHKRLGLAQECACFDLGLGCSAFVYCAQVASSMLACSDARRALVIVGETPSKYVYPEDRSQVMLAGDGGAAVIFEKTENDSRIAGRLCTDGKGYRSIIVPAGGFRNMDATHEPMMWEDENPRTLYNTNMNGMDVFTFTMTKVPRTIKAFLKETEQEIERFDCLAFHQANLLIHQQLAKKLKVDIAKMPLCIDHFGNTSTPAIPLLLSDVYGGEEDARELNVLMAGFGIGLSWGVMSATINTADVLPVVETDDYFAEGVINSPADLL